MADSEFQVGTYTYRAARLDARKQFDVARRLAYAIVQLGGKKEAAFQPTAQNFARIILVTTGNVPQADIDQALNICLGAVSRQMPDGRGWAPIMAKNGAPMFEDIGMDEMLQIVWHVIDAHRMVDFLAVPDSNSAEP